MTSQDINLNNLYSELNKHEANEDYENTLTISDKILKKIPDDEIAFRCKIISLIRLSKFKECLPYFENNKFNEILTLEKAYCRYRLNEPEKALHVISSSTEVSFSIKELEAQILYRLERYEQCFDLYRQIIKNTHDEYEVERAVNFSAVLSYIPEKHSRDIPVLPERTYELQYNIACCLVERGNYPEAIKKLQESEVLCREMLEEDGSSEEDIIDETAVIRGQQAYCFQMMGHKDEAQKIYTSILKQKPKDIGLIAITSNNSMALNEDQNIFDMKKKLRSLSVDGLENKLTTKQNAVILLNQCLFALSANQNSQCIQLCEKLKTKYPAMKEDAILIQALLLSRQKQSDEAVKLLLDYGKGSAPSEQLKIKLTAVQIILTQGKNEAACQILENLGDVMYKPGIISTLVTLHCSLGHREKASKYLDDAIEWHIKNKKKDTDISPLWRQIAEFHLQGGDPKIAAKSLEELLRLNPNDKKIIAKLVIACAQFDENKALEYSKQLPQLKTDDVNIENVLRFNWTSQTKLKKVLAKADQQSTAKPAATELINKEVKKKKKKRKSKLPKNYDPNVDPDPNRWLPKHERTGVKKRRDRRIVKDSGIGKGTQGTASTSSDQYDITKMPSQAKPSAQTNAAVNGPRSQHNRFQQRKQQQQKKKRR